MAGYSRTLLHKKLGIKAEHLVTLLDAPDRFEETLGALPDGVVVRRGLRGSRPFDEILLFVEGESTLQRRFVDAMKRLAVDGGLWVAWRKGTKSGDGATAGAEVRAFGLSTGLVDNKVCAIDATWSGLRFVVRVENRAAWADRVTA